MVILVYVDTKNKIEQKENPGIEPNCLVHNENRVPH